MRYTYELVCVGLTLAAKPLDEHWAYDVAQRAGLDPLVTQLVVATMRTHHWLATVAKQPGIAGKPRVLVRVTTNGIDELRKVCEFADGKPLYAQRMPPPGALDVSPDDVSAPTRETEIEDPFPPALVVVGLVIASSPHDERWAHGIAVRTQLPPSTVMRARCRMAAAGWLTHRRHAARTGRGHYRQLFTVTRPALPGCAGSANTRRTIPTSANGCPRSSRSRPTGGRTTTGKTCRPPLLLRGRTACISTQSLGHHSPELPRGNCRECGVGRTLLDDGTMPDHSTEPGVCCEGSKQLPFRR